mmetsp:Transcript_16444/g.51143  ORF Transcript_16444/g.51143 Transcript_16444/m.51143 type:complete len:219 (-) Transcript_16444:175-831(-)
MAFFSKPSAADPLLADAEAGNHRAPDAPSKKRPALKTVLGGAAAVVLLLTIALGATAVVDRATSNRAGHGLTSLLRRSGPTPLQQWITASEYCHDCAARVAGAKIAAAKKKEDGLAAWHKSMTTPKSYLHAIRVKEANQFVLTLRHNKQENGAAIDIMWGTDYVSSSGITFSRTRRSSSRRIPTSSSPFRTATSSSRNLSRRTKRATTSRGGTSRTGR